MLSRIVHTQCLSCGQNFFAKMTNDPSIVDMLGFDMVGQAVFGSRGKTTLTA